jgi:hypothetical protein
MSVHFFALSLLFLILCVYGIALAILMKTPHMQTMQKKAMLWTAVATTAAAIVIYYIRRKRNREPEQVSHGRTKHLTRVFTRAKGIAQGEYTL